MNMILTDLLSLSRYIADGHKLKTREAARYIWEVEALERRHCARVDFAGIAHGDISPEFISELFRLEWHGHDEVWLVPVNYSGDMAHLLAGCLSKLKKKRFSSMQEGFIKAGLHFESIPESSP